MLTFFFLFGVVVVLLILVGYAYQSDGRDPEQDPEPDRRLDRLAIMLDPEVMEGVIQRARTEGCSEIVALNRLIRLCLGSPPRS